jgi:hypothetical protein
MTILAQTKAFWGDDPVSNFFHQTWPLWALFLIVAIVGAYLAKKKR